MRAGATDFIVKPWRNDELQERVFAAINARPGNGDSAATENLERSVSPRGQILGESAAIAAVRASIGKVGPTRANVLVTGPDGSGRNLVARALHAASPERANPPVRIDARDADQLRQIDRIPAGTVVLTFLDELDPVAQDRLANALRVEVRAIGIAGAAERIEPRLRCRIGVVEIAMPPLAERGEDALLLANHFARLAQVRHGRRPSTFTPDAEEAILAARWPDEVRGLAHAVERAVVLSEGDRIDSSFFMPASPRLAGAESLLQPTLSESEREIVAATLKRHAFNVTQAAAALGISRTALYRRMEKYRL
jgi:DNA-binding NtrC family response regulator